MRIALYHNAPSGGARRAMVEIVKGLVARGHAVDEFCPQTADRAFLPLDGTVGRTTVLPISLRGVAPRRIPMLTPYLTAARLLGDMAELNRAGRAFARLMDAGGYDVVFTHDCQFMLNPDGLRFVSAPTAHYCHHGVRSRQDAPAAPTPVGALERVKTAYYAVPVRIIPWLLEKRAKQNIRAAGRVLTNSQFAQQRIRRHYGIASDVCYLGVDTERFRPLGTQRETFALSVGAVHYHKGYRFLVAALARIPEAIRPRLVIAANADEPVERNAIERLAQEKGVALSVVRVMRDADLIALHNRAAVFVYAPIDEPWGLAAVEAMACGAPVVAVREGGVAESVGTGESGLLVERDEQAFAEAVRRVLTEDALADRLGRAAADRARRCFTWERTVTQVEMALRETAAGVR